MNKLVFIVGAPRSGTKFLRNTLVKSGPICIMPETHFFSKLIHAGVIKKTRFLFPFDSDEKLSNLKKILESKEIFGSWWRYHNDIDYSNVIQKFRESKCRTYRELFLIILNEYAQHHKCDIVGERTPTNIFHVKRLLEWFPDAKIIHILRNPFSVIASEFYVSEKLGFPLKKNTLFYRPLLFPIILLRWYIIYRLHFYYNKKYPSNYMLVKYEELYLNRGKVLAEISKFLNVKLDARKSEKLEIVNSSFGNKGNYNPLNSWKTNLPFVYKLLIQILLFFPLRRINKL